MNTYSRNSDIDRGGDVVKTVGDMKTVSSSAFLERINPDSWFESLRAQKALYPEHFPPKRLGVSFSNLVVDGFQLPTQYQSTFSTVTYGWIIALRDIFMSTHQKVPVNILKGFDGLVDSGELLLVLGRPGSGCSTLLKSLAGETRGLSIGPTSRLNYRGISPEILHSELQGECVYSAELDVHFAELTVSDMLGVAASSRSPRYGLTGSLAVSDSNMVRDSMVELLRLQNCKGTKMGNEFIQGISGGEKKRASIAEVLISWSPIQFWDNSTRGLDSTTAFRLVDIIRCFASSIGAAAVMSLYQVPDSIYTKFSKVTILYEGYQIYFGPIDAAKEYFVRLGYKPPPKATIADFLTALKNPLEAKNLIADGYENRAPRTAKDFSSIWKRSAERKKLLSEIEVFNSKFPLDGEELRKIRAARKVEKMHGVPQGSPYTINLAKQTRITVQRGFLRLRNNLTPPLSSTIGNIILAVVIGSIFYDLPEDTSSFYGRGFLIYFSILMNGFLSAFEVSAVWDQRAIAGKHKRFAFYHPFVEAIAGMVCDLPNKLGTSIFFNLILYFMTNLRRIPEAFFIFWLFSFTCLLTMSMFFRAVGSTSRTLVGSIVPVAVFMMNYMIYTGFILPAPYMHPWLKWFAYIDPIAYAFESLMINEFSDRQFVCSQLLPSGPVYNTVNATYKACITPSSVAGSSFVQGDRYIETVFLFSKSHLWRNLAIMIAMLVIFCICHLVTSEYILAQRPRGEVLFFPHGRQPKQRHKKIDHEEGTSYTISDELLQMHESGRPLVPTTGILTKQVAVVHWTDVCYDIPDGKHTRRILNNIDGWVRPRTLTALMGTTGAGKTTLLNILANRVTSGTVTGHVLVHGKGRDSGFQRMTGYAQQTDYHLPSSTVREALQFSAVLRQPQHISREAKLAYVEEVIRVMGMSRYADAIIGWPGEGLNLEQRKRLTIAVEIAARPELMLFLDEPTSGMDSQTAWSIITLLENLAQHSQAILCTIHQPSALLFEKFDKLLLVSPRGEQLYFGDIGPGGSKVTEFFESRGARPCGANENPADWVIEITGESDCKDIDWVQEWKQSHELKQVKEILMTMKQDLSQQSIVVGTSSQQEFAAPFLDQLRTVTIRIFTHYWRTPTYIWSKIGLCVGVAFSIGFSFWMTPSSIQGIQNQLFALFMLLTQYSNLIQQMMPEFTNGRDLYEAAEFPSKTYSWKVFVMANILVELFWQTIVTIPVFALWYYPMGMYRDTEGEIAQRGGIMFLFILAFFILSSTLAHLVVAGIPHPTTAVQIGALVNYLVLIFSGVLVPPGNLPRFWIFMYRISPLTYLIGGIMAIGIGHKRIECSSIELLKFPPPNSESCGMYMKSYLEIGPGTLLNPESLDMCIFCPVSTSDDILSIFGIDYSKRWRNLGLLVIYILFNISMTFFIFWVARVPKRKSAKSKKKPI